MFHQCSGMFAVIKSHIDWEHVCMTQAATIPTIVVNYLLYKYCCSVFFGIESRKSCSKWMYRKCHTHTVYTLVYDRLLGNKKM